MFSGYAIDATLSLCGREAEESSRMPPCSKAVVLRTLPGAWLQQTEKVHPWRIFLPETFDLAPF